MRWAFFFRNRTLQEDPQADISCRAQFNKPPWYSRSDKLAPIASEEVELFLALVRKTVLSPAGFSNFLPNISSNESSALKEIRLLKQQGFSVFLQDKASRFVIAKRAVIEDKVDVDLDDSTRYTKLEEDDTGDILLKIVSWWSKSKSHLTTVDEDILNWLVNPEAKAGKLKVLLKTHKPNLPVREVFSVCSQPVENLSAFLQYSYLGPIVNSGVLKWRLRDTKEFIQFVHGFNDFIRENKISSPLSLCTVDIKNMFPSIFKELAFPAIKKQLERRGHSRLEVQAVLEALEIVRDGTRVKWKEDIIKQVEGCSLGPADSCDYSDIALDSFLQILIPRLDTVLVLDLK